MDRATTFRGQVPAELHGVRLDRGLAQLVQSHSRARLRELVEAGCVTLDGVRAERPSTPLEAGQELVVELRERERRPSAAPAEELRVLHSDEHLIVVDKPAGMLAHPSGRVAGGTVSEILVERFGPLPTPQGTDRPGLVHRLDADTTGVLVAARTEPAAEHLMAQFRERTVEKHYRAVVRGEPRFDSDWIDAPIGRSKRHPDRMAVTDEESGRAASTFYELWIRHEVLSVLDCRPVTGRTHQIRVHLASIGHAVLGDTLYGRGGQGMPPLPKDAPVPARQALHALSLELDHPSSGERLRFESPLAADIKTLVEWLVAEGGRVREEVRPA